MVVLELVLLLSTTSPEPALQRSPLLDVQRRLFLQQNYPSKKSFKELLSLSVADVSDAIAIEKMFSTIKTEFGAIDILISNAGYLPKPMAVRNSSVDEGLKG